MMPKVFIDGQEGTTGLQIYDRLAAYDSIELLRIEPDKRKDLTEKKRLLNQADLVFLCLPDAAARESVALIDNPNIKVIDASTAHRTNPDWVYGFPELKGQQEKILTAQRVANPGCHATGFISLVRPLVELGILSKDAPLTCFSLTGYSGGGKAMIAQYEDTSCGSELSGGKQYALTQEHKHLPEMQYLCGLEVPPVFTPIVVPCRQGMATTVPLHLSQLVGISTLSQLKDALERYYENAPSISVELGGNALYPQSATDSDALAIVVAGNNQQCTLTAVFDNLGKGASGAAVQNMNLMLGLTGPSQKG